MTVHELVGCRVEVPDDWELVHSPDQQRLIVVEPERTEEAGFRANIVLTAVDNGGLSFCDWQAGTDELMPRQLSMYLLLDLERLAVAGREDGRRLAEHVVDGRPPVTMEQWFTLVGPTGYTLTATVDSWRYDEYADFFSEIAEKLSIFEGGHPGAAGVQHAG